MPPLSTQPWAATVGLFDVDRIGIMARYGTLTLSHPTEHLIATTDKRVDFAVRGREPETLPPRTDRPLGPSTTATTEATVATSERERR